MLEKFRQAKEAEIAALKKNGAPAPWEGHRPSFSGALAGQGLAVIAEYKRASPSRGTICANLGVDEAAAQYARAGAAALSILTETDWFKGDLAHIARASRTGLPVLRKDFIFDPLQVRATAATPASAVLLIVRSTPDARDLRALREEAESLGLEAVVEAFSVAEVETARESGARIIQINARDLQKLRVDRDAALAIIAQAGKRPGEIWIAASGMESGAHLAAAAKAGYDAALVGTALMRGGRPGAALERLLAEYGS